MPTKTAKGLVDFCIGQANRDTVYMWGSFGHEVTAPIITRFHKQYPEWYTPARCSHFHSLIGKEYRAFDCVGLIKSYVWGDYRQGNTMGYKVAQDISADRMCQIATVKGDISTLPEREGVCVWMDGHVGVYIGGGSVIEATPKWKNGVQLRRLSDRKWLKWFECPFIHYEKAKETIKMERYKTLRDVPAHYKNELIELIDAGALKGKSGTGDNMEVDLSEDLVRALIISKRYIDSLK